MKKTVDVTLSSYEDVLRIKQSRIIITSKRWKNIFGWKTKCVKNYIKIMYAHFSKKVILSFWSHKIASKIFFYFEILF